MGASVVLIVNDTRHQVTVPDTTPLLDILRDELGLRGTRFGCGEGVCGACTVLVDGRPETACNTPVAAVVGKTVTTIEGIINHGILHPLQQAFTELQAGQCGYCLNGIIMRALAFLRTKPTPTRTEIATALDMHLCRCGAHDRILRAVALGASRMAETRTS